MQNPPLIEAVEFGDIKRVKEILKMPGMDINVTNGSGFTAATIAAMRNNNEILRILYYAGADLYKRANNSQNAIDWIRAHDNKEMLRLIEQRGK